MENNLVFKTFKASEYIDTNVFYEDYLLYHIRSCGETSDVSFLKSAGQYQIFNGGNFYAKIAVSKHFRKNKDSIDAMIDRHRSFKKGLANMGLTVTTKDLNGTFISDDDFIENTIFYEDQPLYRLTLTDILGWGILSYIDDITGYGVDNHHNFYQIHTNLERALALIRDNFINDGVKKQINAMNIYGE